MKLLPWQGSIRRFVTFNKMLIVNISVTKIRSIFFLVLLFISFYLMPRVYKAIEESGKQRRERRYIGNQRFVCANRNRTTHSILNFPPPNIQLSKSPGRFRASNFILLSGSMAILFCSHSHWNLPLTFIPGPIFLFSLSTFLITLLICPYLFSLPSLFHSPSRFLSITIPIPYLPSLICVGYTVSITPPSILSLSLSPVISFTVFLSFSCSPHLHLTPR